MSVSDDLQLLQLMKLVSPALPVGAFAYSQGLEGAIEQQWLTDINEEQRPEEAAQHWISGVLHQNIVKLDLPALFWQLDSLEKEECSSFNEFNELIFAMRETSELRLESQQMGAALLKLLRDTEQELEPKLKKLLFDSELSAYQAKIDWVSAFAIACKSGNISSKQALLGYGWAWCETQVAAAIKLVPLGQTQGQKILNQLINELAKLIEELLKSMPDKNNIGAISPNLAIISSLHEQQYSRLFRS